MAGMLVKTNKARKLELFTNREHLISFNAKSIEQCRQLKFCGTTQNPNISISVSSTGMPMASKPFNLTQDKCVDIGFLKEHLDSILRKKYFLCRSITPPYMMTSLHTVVEDPAGTYAVHLCLYNYTNIPQNKLDLQERLLPVGTVLAILNPYLKSSADGGVILRCDNPGDVVMLEGNSHLLKDIVWKGEFPQQYRSKVKIPIEAAPLKTAEDCKLAGNRLFGRGVYHEALQMYVSGLLLSPKHSDLLANKCMTNIKLENFCDALEDVESLLELDPKNLKAKYRKALALVGLRRYQDAVTYLDENVTDQDASLNRFFYETINSLKLKLKKQLAGFYDMVYFTQNENNPDLDTFPACAEYLGPVKLVNISGKGRGIIAKETITAGALVMVSKVFIRHISKSEDNIRPCDINLETGSQYRLGARELITLAAQRLTADPELGKEFYSLHAGPRLGHLDVEKDRYDMIDMKRIEGICHYNALRFSVGSKAFSEINEQTFDTHSGIWLQPSFLNHSCVNANAYWLTLKDFMFVRAFKDIDAGAEILISYVEPEIYSQRKYSLKRWDIDCSCDLCLIESNEPKTHHETRARILQEVAKIPWAAPLSRQQVVKLKRCRARLEKLRPDGKYNVSLVEVEMKLGKSYFSTGNFLEAAKCAEKVYYLSQSYCPRTALRAVQTLIKCYVNGKEPEKAMFWQPISIAQEGFVYGPENVGHFFLEFDSEVF